MNTNTARALFVGLLIAVWAWLGGEVRLQVSLWAGLVGLGCYWVSGGGVPGLQKAVIGLLSGVAWVLIADAVRGAIGGGRIVAALIVGAVGFGIMMQARVPLLAFTAGAFAGAGVAWGLGVNTLTEGIRAGVGLGLGAVVGFAAERLAGLVGARRA